MTKFFRILALTILVLHCGGKLDVLPEKLGQLMLQKVTEGSEATTTIEKMHGKSLNPAKNYIGFYGEDNSGNTLYVSAYEDDQKAKQDFMQMSMRLASSTTQFEPITFHDMGGSVRFKTRGMGFEHHFYRQEHLIIWWQVQPEQAETSYNDLLNFQFPQLKK